MVYLTESSVAVCLDIHVDIGRWEWALFSRTDMTVCHRGKRLILRFQRDIRTQELHSYTIKKDSNKDRIKYKCPARVISQNAVAMYVSCGHAMSNA